MWDVCIFLLVNKHTCAWLTLTFGNESVWDGCIGLFQVPKRCFCLNSSGFDWVFSPWSAWPSSITKEPLADNLFVYRVTQNEASLKLCIWLRYSVLEKKWNSASELDKWVKYFFDGGIMCFFEIFEHSVLRIQITHLMWGGFFVCVWGCVRNLF